jgi:hypothetical protein
MTVIHLTFLNGVVESHYIARSSFDHYHMGIIESPLWPLRVVNRLQEVSQLFFNFFFFKKKKKSEIYLF